MTRVLNTLALVAAFGLVLGTGCSKKDGDPAAKGGEAAQGQAAAGGADAPAKAAMPAFVEMIPAETPYVIAGLQPMDKAIADKMFKAMDPLLAQMQSELKSEMANMGEATSNEDKLAKAVMEELDGKLNAKGLAELGISTTPTYALYGIGLMPVVRIELADPAKLKAAIGRVETKAGVKAPVLKSGDVEYYGVVEDGLHMVIAIQGNELVFGLTPDSMAKTTVPMILGTTKPEKNLAKSGVFEAMMKDYGYKGIGLGYVDNMAIASTLLGEGKGINAQVLVEMNKSGANIGTVDDVCKGEIKGLVSMAPRIVFGSKQADTKLWITEFIVETKSELTKELKGLAAPVAGLGIDNGGLMSFGFGLDVGKTITFLKGKAAAVKANPYKCAFFADMNQGFAEMEMGLNQPLPPVINNLRGLYVNVKSADTSTMPPKAIKAVAVLAANKPAELFAMAQGMVPPLATLKLAPGGEPVAIPAAELGIPPFVEAPHAAMGENAIAISVGAGEEKGLKGALSAKTPAEPPLFSFGYDVGAFMGAIQAQTKAMLEGMPEEFRKEQEAQMKASAAVGEVFGVVHSNVTLGDKGIVIEQRLHIK